jgi:hypothetical protein
MDNWVYTARYYNDTVWLTYSNIGLVKFSSINFHLKNIRQ